MDPASLAAASVLLSALGVLAGWWFSRLAPPWWLLGWLAPLLLIAANGVASHHPALYFTPPLCWLLLGRFKFGVMGFVAAMALTTPMARLPRRQDRHAVFGLMVVIVLAVSIWPFLAPRFNRHQLEQLRTRVDGDGVCRQTTGYTCGPAAAVTALRRLGLPAEEGRLAILSGTSFTTGTSADFLAAALQREYGRAGLMVSYRPFQHISDLKTCGPTVALVKFAFLLDHYVTVLSVTDDTVVVGDPLIGLVTMSRDEFRRQWRFVGIALQRRP